MDPAEFQGCSGSTPRGVLTYRRDLQYSEARPGRGQLPQAPAQRGHVAAPGNRMSLAHTGRARRPVERSRERPRRCVELPRAAGRALDLFLEHFLEDLSGGSLLIQGEIGDDLLEPAILVLELLDPPQLGNRGALLGRPERLGDLLVGESELFHAGPPRAYRTALSVAPQLPNGPDFRAQVPYTVRTRSTLTSALGGVHIRRVFPPLTVRLPGEVAPRCGGHHDPAEA